MASFLYAQYSILQMHGCFFFLQTHAMILSIFWWTTRRAICPDKRFSAWSLWLWYYWLCTAIPVPMLAPAATPTLVLRIPCTIGAGEDARSHRSYVLYRSVYLPHRAHRVSTPQAQKGNEVFFCFCIHRRLVEVVNADAKRACTSRVCQALFLPQNR